MPATILGMGSANERRRYIVASSLIGWARIEKEPCIVLGCMWKQTSVFSYRDLSP